MPGTGDHVRPESVITMLRNTHMVFRSWRETQSIHPVRAEGTSAFIPLPVPRVIAFHHTQGEQGGVAAVEGAAPHL